MREFIFRGKRIDNGEWVEGFLYITHNGEYEIGRYDPYVNIERITFVVAPATVGQYTGLTDKNGKRIYEGDIVANAWYRGVVSYGEFNCSCCDGVFGWSFGNADIRNYDRYEVIGNIHDNPELLEGE